MKTKNIICFFFFFSVFLNVTAQDFSNINELISIASKNPSSLESSIKKKGFLYSTFKNNRQSFKHKINESYINYELNPRVLEYTTSNRQFYLDAFSYLSKAGYTVKKNEVQSLVSKEKHEADGFTKGKISIYLYANTSYSGTIESYSILIYPGTLSGGKVSSNKQGAGYGNFYVSLLNPNENLKAEPTTSNSVEQSFTGSAGLGATPGIESGFSGIVGLDELNKNLPSFIDFGLHMRVSVGVQPFALASEDYKYSSFFKLDAGGGPALMLTPFRNTDLVFAFFYDFLPSLNDGGAIEYIGSDRNYSKTVERDSSSFAFSQVMGFELKYKSLLLGIESSKYIDKGKYTISSGTNGNITDTNFEAALPINQIAFKLGICF